MITALLVEDDARLAELTRTYLSRHDVVVTTSGDGEQGLALALAHSFDVVLLDVMLPGLDGIEVCRRIRERSAVPIIMLTARDEEADRVMGLELGADDYMVKPYSPRELLARIRVRLRRSQGRAGPALETFEVGPLRVDVGARAATLDGRPLDLTGYEFDLLRALVEHAGRVLSRERLMTLAKGSADESFDRSVDVHISHLRGKLGDDPRRPRLIKTVRGAGYQLVLT